MILGLAVTMQASGLLLEVVGSALTKHCRIVDCDQGREVHNPTRRGRRSVSYPRGMAA